MALRGKTPEKIEKRLKAFFYGGAGVGKTTAAIQFPAPYLIDTEKGAENDQYVKMLQESNGAIFQTSSFEELIQEIKALMTEEHSYKTLVIDPLTTIYNQLLIDAENDPKVGSEFGRHYNAANRKMKHLFNLLTRLDMNVIITSHAKNEYGDGLKVLGQTFDCYKKLDYLFDLVIEIQKQGNVRRGYIKKSRIESFKDGDNFIFSYQEIANRYGSTILEKTAVTEVLANQIQIDELKHLINLLKIPAETTDKWLEKCKAESFEEMPADCIEKCIEALNEKIKNKAA